MSKKLALLAAAMLLTTPAFAFDGWHTENVTPIPSKTAGYDYISIDTKAQRLFLGRRGEGLQVFDIATHKVIKTFDTSAQHSANGAALAPDLDVAMISNEDGTYIPFKISTLEALSPAVKIAEGIDTSHYDPMTKRFFFNTEPGADGTPVMAINGATLKAEGQVMVPTKKAEGAIADGKGKMYLAGQLESKIFVIDTVGMKIAATWSSPVCGKPTMLEVDTDAKRLFVTCRTLGAIKPVLVVLNTDNGATVWSAEIGDGSDGIAYDKATKRIFSANGIHATLTVAEMKTPDSFRIVETLSTYNNAKVIAMDTEKQKVYSMGAEGSSNTDKKINTTVSPWFANTVIPNTFRVITFGK